MRKTVLSAILFVVCLLGLVGLASAQCPAAPQSILPTAVTFAAPTANTAPATPQYELTATAEETQFLATGPRLYPMDKALQLSKATGKPVLCWMGVHLFADRRARELSNELRDTTIQAVMDKDNTPYDAVGYRVKFSDGNYGDGAKTYYVKLSNFDRPGEGEKILGVARGGR